MKRNAVIPYAIIAIVGIVMVIVISVAGVNQREAIQKKAEGNQTEQKEEGKTTEAPEDIFASSCASCHGDDLSGNVGPDLRKIGGQLSKDDIHNIIMNGKGQMPPGLVNESQADVLADWLAKHK